MVKRYRPEGDAAVTKALPILLILIDLGSAVVYTFAHDPRRAIYWLAAAVLTASVTF